MKRSVKKKFVTGKKIKPVTLEKFGKRLRQLRKAAGYTSQLTFAYEQGFNPPQVNKWERGEDIKLSNISRLCDALEISVADFFSEGFK
ncbi:hypothetical protein BH11BAC2_BH11BAC2_06370 [soil metagenome]